MRKILLASVVAVSASAIVGPAIAGHSWAKYHWPLTAEGTPSIPIRYNTANVWLSGGGDEYVINSIRDWDNPPAGVPDYFDLSNVQRDTSLSRSSCTPDVGEVTYCSDNYGNTGWLGIAGVYAGRRDGHITRGYVKLNDTYYDNPNLGYDNYSDRASVACQEVGHVFGLGHQNEDFSTDLTTSCMEYTSDSTNNEDPDAHDWEQLQTIYGAHFAEGSGGGKPGGGGGKPGGGGGKPDKNRGVAVDFADPMAFREVGQIHQSSGRDHPVFGTPIGWDAQGRPNVFKKLRGASEVEVVHVTWVPGYQPEGEHHGDDHDH